MGRRTSAVVVAIAGVLALVAAPAAAAAPERIVDVVRVTWPGATDPTATAGDLARVVSSDTIDRWRRMSNGTVEFTLGQTLPDLPVLAAMPCDAYGSLMYMTSIRAAVYERAGIGDTAHRFLLILTPRPAADCVWDGRGLTNAVPSTSGTVLLKNTIDPYVVAHELGHNLGLGHSNLERCSSGKPDDLWSRCNAIEYGSATDIMGNNDRDSVLSAYHLWRLGIIGSNDVARPRADGSVMLQPVTKQTGTRAIFLRDNAAAYWIEYRQADPKNQISQGLVVYRADPPPGSSVVSPIASDVADAANTNVTTDVWMINLGDYAYAPPQSTGSPALSNGSAFTTAFGGYTVTATALADGAAQVLVRKSLDRTPPASPTLTDERTWHAPNAELIARAYLDAEDDIARIEARIDAAAGSKIVAIPTTSSTDWSPTYLHPIDPPTNVLFSSLPEGKYTLALRAIDAAGNVGAWSASVPVLADRGRPTVTDTALPDVEASSVGSSVTVRWTGATDAGAGVCDARTVAANGFALYSWTAAAPGVPRLRVPANGSVDAAARVFDCLGNGVAGRLQVESRFTPASTMSLTGTWRRSGSVSTCSSSCTATFTSSGATALVVGAGSGQVFVDGKPYQRITSSEKRRARVAARVLGTHRVRITAKNLTLVGAQTVTLQWTQTGTIDRAPFTLDSSLEDRTQVALSNIGLAQEDFSDDQLVRPMTGGTELKDPSLDWCEAKFNSETQRQARRQVVVTAKTGTQPYSFLSSETVRYTSSAAVRQALIELDAADASCRQRGGSLSQTGLLNAYAYLTLPELPTGLRPASDRRIFWVNMGPANAQSCMLVVYQFKHDLLNGLYLVRRGSNSLSADEVLEWLRVAEVLATRM